MEMTEKKTMGQWLGELAGKTESSEADSQMMQSLLRRLGFNKAVVIYGIVYLEGHGTLQSPPAGIHTVAKGLMAQVEAQQ